MFTLHGKPICVTDTPMRVPKMQLNKDFAAMMPMDFVERTNAWMKDFFGTKSVAYEANGTLYMDRPTLNRLIAELNDKGK